jgi:hypothetical protein
VDLTTGWLTVDGSSRKTLTGQSYRLSGETIATLKRIWKPARKHVFAYATLWEITSHFCNGLCHTFYLKIGMQYARQDSNLEPTDYESAALTD